MRSDESYGNKGLSKGSPRATLSLRLHGYSLILSAVAAASVLRAAVASFMATTSSRQKVSHPTYGAGRLLLKSTVTTKIYYSYLLLHSCGKKKGLTFFASSKVCQITHKKTSLLRLTLNTSVAHCLKACSWPANSSPQVNFMSRSPPSSASRLSTYFPKAQKLG